MKPEVPQDIWEQMDELTKEEFRNDPGISISEFAARYRLSYECAKHKLYNLEREGKVVRGQAWRGSRPRPVFRPVEENK
jgi:hypothetical protein